MDVCVYVCTYVCVYVCVCVYVYPASASIFRIELTISDKVGGVFYDEYIWFCI